MPALRPITKFERTSLIIQGIITVLFGIAAVFWPGLTIVTLLYLFGIFLLVDGVIYLVMGFTKFKTPATAVLFILLGLFQLALGLFLLRNPDITFATFIILLGLAFLIRGIFSLGHAIFGPGSGGMRVLNGLVGALGIIVGIIIFMQPVAGGVAFVWVLGLYALIAGPVMIAIAAGDEQLTGKATKKR